MRKKIVPQRNKDNEIILNLCNNREFSNPEIEAIDHMLSDEAWLEYLDSQAEFQADET